MSPADPYAFVMLTGIAHVHMIRGEYAEALAVAEQSMASSAGFDPTRVVKAAAMEIADPGEGHHLDAVRVRLERALQKLLWIEGKKASDRSNVAARICQKLWIRSSGRGSKRTDSFEKLSAFGAERGLPTALADARLSG